MVKRRTFVALDDEQPALRALEALMQQHTHYEAAGYFSCIDGATERILTASPDLLFLDIHMARMSGIDFLKSLPVRPVTVFVTAHAQYAFDAFEMGVRDYLLKPVEPNRLSQALSNLAPLMDQEKSDVLAFKNGHGHSFIDLGTISYIRAEGNFSTIVQTGGELTTISETLGGLTLRLTPFGFCRVHRTTLVNWSHASKANASQVILIDGSAHSIGRKYRSEVDKNIQPDPPRR